MRRFVLTLTFALPSFCLAEGKPDVNFERDILPIFKDRCFSCHDEKKQRAAYRLDVRNRAFAGGESGKKGVVPGKVNESELLRRISSRDETERMPPKGPSLSDAQVAALRRWVETGAGWPDALANEGGEKHWAFVAPSMPAFPEVKNLDWGRNPIDRFILAKLEKEGLTPAPEADRVTLIRRLSLDLIGLPPSPKEVDEFVNDPSPNAYERLVDRLLSSEHYGERWARLWLDAARYADSDGFEKDKPRFVWAYRDWVIHAFNRDLPYHRFVVEQVAGDLLPNATQDQRVATGFLRNSMINEEGGIDPEQFRMEAMFDRMDAIGKGVLGITIQCAQCHTHKYDPLTHAEYYRLFAFLNNAHEANLTVYSPDEQVRRTEIFRQIKEIEDDLKHRIPDWPVRVQEWERQLPPQPNWTVLRPQVLDESTGGQKYLLQPDGSFLAQGYAPTKHRVHFTTRVDAKSIAALQIELLNDPNLPRGGPGRSIEGTGALTEFEVELAIPEVPDQKMKVKFRKATADVEMPPTPIKGYYHDKSDNSRRYLGPVDFAIDGNDLTAWGHDIDPGRRNQPRKAVFTLENAIKSEGGFILHIYLKQNHGGWNSDDNQNMNLGRFRLSFTDAPDAEADRVPAGVREILNVPFEKRSPAQLHALFSHWRRLVPALRETNARIEALWKTHPEGSTQLALQERAEMRPTNLLKRGDFLKPAEKVTPGVPAFLHPLPEWAEPNRLTFANWLVDPKSPTTARAYVNRVWQSYFGTGIVSSSEDLGKQAEPPSHPELLDYLAVDFVESGWGMKQLHKRIVLSSTYRQSSKVTKELQAKDPVNRLLARGPRFRVDAEVVRDIALSASGLLNLKVGGASVYPPIPQFLMLPPASYGPKVWKEETGPDRYRRALYTFRFRSVPFPALQAFDAPNGDFSCVKRPRSNTPLQALAALNEPIFVECAQGLAARVLAETEKDDERIEYAFRLCVGRKPSERERMILGEMLRKERERFDANEAKAKEFVQGRIFDVERGKLSETASWTALARVLLNLDETMSKE